MPSHYHSDGYGMSSSGGYRYDSGSSVGGGGMYGSGGAVGGSSMYSGSGMSSGGEYRLGRTTSSSMNSNTGDGLMPYPTSASYSTGTLAAMRSSNVGISAVAQAYNNASRPSYSAPAISRSTYDNNGFGRQAYDPPSRVDYTPGVASRPTYEKPVVQPRTGYDVAPQRSDYDDPPMMRASMQRPGYGEVARDPAPVYGSSAGYSDDQGFGGLADMNMGSGSYMDHQQDYNSGQGLMSWDEGGDSQMVSGAVGVGGHHLGYESSGPRVPGRGLMDRPPEREVRVVESAKMRGGGSQPSNIIGAVGKLTQMGNPESKIALDILNAVLRKPEQQSLWEGEPAHKMRRTDWDGGRGSHRRESGGSPPMRLPPPRKYSQSDYQRSSRQPWEGSPWSSQYGSSSSIQYSRVYRGKRTKPRSEGGENSAKDHKKGSAVPSKSTPKRKETKAEKQDDAAQDSSGPQGLPARLFVPSEVLECHMCKLKNFNTVGGFLQHTKQQEHHEAAKAFHSVGSAVLNLLLVEAKLAMVRNAEAGGQGNQRCRRCNVFTNLKDHNNSLEHLLVSQFMKVRCCGLTFATRGELEEHRLTLKHYRYLQQHKPKEEEEQSKEEKEEEHKKEVEAIKIIQETYAKLKDGTEQPYTSATLPPFDPEKPIGLDTIQTRSFYKCAICPENKVRFTSEILIKTHFHSYAHYENVANNAYQKFMQKREQHLKSNELKRKRLAEKKEEKEQGKEGEQDEGNKEGETAEKKEQDGDVTMEELEQGEGENEGGQTAEGDHEEAGDGEMQEGEATEEDQENYEDEEGQEHEDEGEQQEHEDEGEQQEHEDEGEQQEQQEEYEVQEEDEPMETEDNESAEASVDNRDTAQAEADMNNGVKAEVEIKAAKNTQVKTTAPTKPVTPKIQPMTARKSTTQTASPGNAATKTAAPTTPKIAAQVPPKPGTPAPNSMKAAAPATPKAATPASANAKTTTPVAKTGVPTSATPKTAAATTPKTAAATTPKPPVTKTATSAATKTPSPAVAKIPASTAPKPAASTPAGPKATTQAPAAPKATAPAPASPKITAQSPKTASPAAQVPAATNTPVQSAAGRTGVATRPASARAAARGRGRGGN